MVISWPAAGRGPSASSSAASERRFTWASFGQGDHRDLDLLAPGHVLLRNVLVAAGDLVAQQVIVQDIGLRRSRCRLLGDHHQTPPPPPPPPPPHPPPLAPGPGSGPPAPPAAR